MTATDTVARPILVELDEDTWKTQIDRVESWLGNVLMVQSTFRQLAEDTADKVKEPHFKEYLGEIAKTARRHEQMAEELYRTIGRRPSTTRRLGGSALSKVRQGLADILAYSGGAAGAWGDIRQMLLVNLDAIGAFGTAEQLGLALGIPAIEDITFQVINEKAAQQMVLQELLLEMAAQSILYKATV